MPSSAMFWGQVRHLGPINPADVFFGVNEGERSETTYALSCVQYDKILGVVVCVQVSLDIFYISYNYDIL